MTDPVLDVTMYLNANEQELAFLKRPSEGAGGNLFMLDMPPVPDQAVAVLRYEGRPPAETFGNPLLTRFPRIQITVRDPSSKVAFDRADLILKYLAKVKNQTINGTVYQRIKPQGEPSELGPDESNRERVIINFEAAFNDSV